MGKGSLREKKERQTLAEDGVRAVAQCQAGSGGTGVLEPAVARTVKEEWPAASLGNSCF